MKIPELFSQQPGRHTFERSNQAGQGHLWGIVDQQVNVVMFAVELHQFSLKVLADAGQDGVHGLQVLLPEHIAPVLGNEYQMHMQYKDTVSAVSQIAIYLAWTCHSASCVSFIDQ